MIIDEEEVSKRYFDNDKYLNPFEKYFEKYGRIDSNLISFLLLLSSYFCYIKNHLKK